MSNMLRNGQHDGMDSDSQEKLGIYEELNIYKMRLRDFFLNNSN